MLCGRDKIRLEKVGAQCRLAAPSVKVTVLLLCTATILA